MKEISRVLHKRRDYGEN